MFIFSKDGETLVNSDNISCFEIEYGYDYNILADGALLGSYQIKDDAIRELNSIFRQLESGATSYQLR